MNEISHTEQTPRKFLKALTIVHIGLTSGAGLFTLVALLLNKDDLNTALAEENKIFLYVAPVFAVSAFLLSGLVFKNYLGKLKTKDSLKEKIAHYQSAFLSRLAFIEAATLFASIVFLITAYLPFIFISGLLLLYLFALRPNKQKVEEDLNLTYQEKVEFDSDKLVS